ncbi:MAG TPA: hypothetical protein VGA84_00660, partial [Thermoanaerobaculia bacterium]
MQPFPHLLAHLLQCRVVTQLRHLGETCPFIGGRIAEITRGDIRRSIALALEPGCRRGEFVLAVAPCGIKRHDVASEPLAAGSAFGEV